MEVPRARDRVAALSRDRLQQKAFHYVRVLEIPTPRWTTYDAKVFGVKLPTDVPSSIQDRAYTSPIWYTPGK